MAGFLCRPEKSCADGIWALKREVADLRAELIDQWQSNHYEHCGSDWPHADGEECFWPRPAILDGATVDEYVVFGSDIQIEEALRDHHHDHIQRQRDPAPRNPDAYVDDEIGPVGAVS